MRSRGMYVGYYGTQLFHNIMLLHRTTVYLEKSRSIKVVKSATDSSAAAAKALFFFFLQSVANVGATDNDAEVDEELDDDVNDDVDVNDSPASFSCSSLSAACFSSEDHRPRRRAWFVVKGHGKGTPSPRKASSARQPPHQLCC